MNRLDRHRSELCNQTQRAKDLNIVGEHRRESILIHANKGCREGAAVRKDRTLGWGGRHHDRYQWRGGTDIARSVAAAAATVDEAAATAAAVWPP